MPYPNLLPEHRYTAESIVKTFTDRFDVSISLAAEASLVADIANELCAYERVGYGSGISDTKQKHAKNVFQTLREAPLGTKAPCGIGGYWTKVTCGWQAMDGHVFPRPGGDWTGELIFPTQS